MVIEWLWLIDKWWNMLELLFATESRIISIIQTSISVVISIPSIKEENTLLSFDFWFLKGEILINLVDKSLTFSLYGKTPLSSTINLAVITKEANWFPFREEVGVAGMVPHRMLKWQIWDFSSLSSAGKFYYFWSGCSDQFLLEILSQMSQ